MIYGNENLRIVAGTLIPEVQGSTVLWSLKSDDNFSSLYLGSTEAVGQNLKVNFTEQFGKIVTMQLNPNAHLRSKGVMVGLTVPLSKDSMTMSMYAGGGVWAGYLIGNGTNWDWVGDPITITTNTVNTVVFTPQLSFGGAGNQNGEFLRGVMATYSGNRNVRAFSVGATRRIELRQFTNTNLVTDNSSNDIIEVMVPYPNVFQVDMNANNVNGFPGNSLLNSNAKLFVNGLMEL